MTDSSRSSSEDVPAAPNRDVLPTTIAVLVERLIASRWWWLGTVLVLTALAWPAAQSLTFDQSIESLFAEANPRLIAFRDSKATFGGDEYVILACREPDLLGRDGQVAPAPRERIETLAAQLKQVPGIDPASVQNLASALRSPYARGRIRLLLQGLLLGEDNQSTAIVSKLLPKDQATVSRPETFRLVRELAARHATPTVVVGEPVQVHDTFRYVEADGATLGWASSGFLMLVIGLLFRSLRWMILPLAVVQLTLINTKAICLWSGAQLSMVSSMLDSLVTIIGIATVMHLTVRFRDLRLLGHDRSEATRLALGELFAPVFWTVATTAAGFAALMTSHIAPVVSFGMMMTIATGLVLVACAAVLPSGLLAGAFTRIPATPPGEGKLADALGGIAAFVLKHPAPTAGVMLILSAASLGKMFGLEVETDFSKNFRDNSPIVQALDFFESNLGGAGTWEVNFPAPAVLDEPFLEKVRALTEDLRTLPEVDGTGRLTKVVALTDGLDLIPVNVVFTRLSLETRLGLLDRVQPAFAEGLFNADKQRMRLMLRAVERQPASAKLRLIEAVEAVSRKHFPEAQATGLFVLLAFLIDSLLADQFTSSLVSGVAMVVLMAIALRSARLGVAMLFPNLFPIVLVLGGMGWLGMKVNIASAMISAVSLGLTIDSSIHYMAGYQRARQAGASVSAALIATHRGVGLALVFANLALVCGFSVLTLSHFVPLVYFGVLVSVAMVGGLFGNLILLPLLLPWLDRQRSL